MTAGRHAAPRSIAWRLRDVLTIFRKELRETLRDRRTLAVMILFPLVVYPLVSLAMAEVMAGKQAQQDARHSRVAVAGTATNELAAIRSLFQKRADIDLVASTDPRRDLREQHIDAYVEVNAPGPVPLQPRPVQAQAARVWFDETHDTSEKAHDRVEGLLAAVLPADCSHTYAVASTSIAPKAQVGGYVLSKILPMIVVLMTMLGAFYPAIDITAGEHERGTLETLLSSPIHRFDLMAGKVLAVTVLAALTGVLNIASMSLTVAEGAKMAAGGGHGLTIPWSRTLATLLTVVPAAFLWASVMVAVGALARTFKEAQNLLTPVYFLCFTPALIASLADFPLTGVAMVVPGTNLTLLARDLMMGEATILRSGVVLLTTLGFGALALNFAARLYDSERLLSSADGDPLDLKAWIAQLVFRRDIRRPTDEDAIVASPPPTVPRFVPTAEHAVAIFAVAFVLWFFAFAWLQRWRLIPGLLISQWVGFLGLVVAYARVNRATFAEVVAFRRPRTSALVGAGLLGMSAWVVLSVLTDKILPPPPSLVEAMRKLIRPTEGHRPYLLTLFALAITPAICEEALFRGVILRGLRQRFRPLSACLITGFLFGVLHGDVWRLLPTTLLGTLLSWVALRSASLIPSMLIHVVNNGALVTLGYFGWDQATENLPESVNVLVLTFAALALVGGVILIARSGHSVSPTSASNRNRPPDDSQHI